MTAVAIHQPNYFPWLGYFLKISLADIFVFHDIVSVSSQTYFKRVSIRKVPDSEQTRWLSVPVARHASSLPLKDIIVDHDQDWISRHQRYIENAYCKAPHYKAVWPRLRELYEAQRDLYTLADINIRVITILCRWLGLENQWHRSSELAVSGKGSQLNIAVVKAAGGDVYLSGDGGASYQSQEEFAAAAVVLKYVRTNERLSSLKLPREYGHLPGLSVIDALMWAGVDGVKEMVNRAAGAKTE